MAAEMAVSADGAHRVERLRRVLAAAITRLTQAPAFRCAGLPLRACCLGNRWLCRQLLGASFQPSICSSAGAPTAPITVLPRSSPLANA